MNSLIRKKYFIRNINGILLINKPYGLSSNLTLQKIKKIFYAKKAGYSGTLDILATGMIPILFGNFTKLSKYILNLKKSYKVIAKLGQRTNTFDSEGKIISKKPVNVNLLQIKKSIKNFCGEIYQTPPMFSAVKYKGKELYKYARKNIIVPRKIKKKNIYKIKILYFNNIDLIKLYISCSKGTYIRSIIDDLGNVLGCGAHVIKLKRLSIGNFLKNKMISLSFLEKIYKKKNKKNYFKNIDKLLLPVDNNLFSIFSNVLSKDKYEKIINK